MCRHLAIIIKFVNLYCLIQDPPKEEDLSFLERPRLEAEYLKLKEQKRKAEQYAVEAKQTAQRVRWWSERIISLMCLRLSNSSILYVILHLSNSSITNFVGQTAVWTHQDISSSKFTENASWIKLSTNILHRCETTHNSIAGVGMAREWGFLQL